MADSNETSPKRKPNTPDKPYADFPLFAHQTGRWAKKILGKIRFYGRWGRSAGGKVVPVENVKSSAAAALKEFQRCWPYHSQGREAPAIDAGEYVTLADLVNSFLSNKKNRLQSGELSAHSFSEYYRTCDKLIESLGRDRRVDDLRPDDFESLRKSMGAGCNLVTLKSKINRARVVFKFAYDSRLIDRPVEFGQSFDRPSTMKLRAAKNASGPNLFSRDELLMILAALEGKPVAVPDEADPVKWPASAVMRAMVLLGLNAGFGNTDCANLPQTAVKLESGWIEFPRPKTAIRRRIPLWTETTAAITQAVLQRPEAADPEDSNLCFLTERGTRFVRVQTSKTDEDRHVTINSLSRRFEQLLSALKIGQRKGAGFYTLRHIFETIAGGSKDQVAVNAIMGHVDSSMADAYREKIDDDRLRAVVDHVRAWLWPETVKKPKPKASKKPAIKNE